MGKWKFEGSGSNSAAFTDLNPWMLRTVQRRVEALIPLLSRGALGAEDLCLLCPTDGLVGLLGGNILFSPAPPFKLLKPVAG